MNKAQPIGIFDSGVGGTSIWKEIHQLLPLEQTLYLADSLHAPYGEKSKEEIIELSFKNTEKLLQMGAKIVVVACNTATTNAIKELRHTYKVPFIGIEPAIKPAFTNSKTQAIGILATKGTLSSALFAKTSHLYSNNAKLIEVVGEGLARAVENGKKDSEEVEILLSTYLKPMIAANIDYLVLGCSHYPYLLPKLQKLLPKTVKIIDSGQAVANQTKLVLSNMNLLAATQQPEPEFFSNGNPEILAGLINSPEKEYKVKRLYF